MKNFGKLAKDKITGFTGIITSKHIYMFGCEQYGLAPPIDKDGKKQQIEFFDTGRIEIFEQKVEIIDVKNESPGCDERERPQ